VTVLAVLGWIALIMLLALVPRLLVEALIYPDRVAAWAGGHWPGHRRPQPGGPPVEKLAVELRRLAGVLIDPRPVSSVRRFGVERAYDETLGKACCALGIEHHLDDVPLSDREFERLRVEAALQEAGLVLRGPACGCPRPDRSRDDGTANE
jgi:hypothetical protein